VGFLLLQHITIILPIAYRGGSLRVTKTIARMIHLGSRNAGAPCDVRIAVLADRYRIESEFGDVISNGIEVREFKWKPVTDKEVEMANFNQGRTIDLPFNSYFMPDDGIDNCADSDLWFLVSDRMEMPLAPIRPYVVFATDYIQRYVPEIFSEAPFDVDLPFLQTAREANAVLTTTPHTRSDAISYAGVPAGKVHLAPMDFDPAPFPDADDSGVVHGQYIVWPTNTTKHKNHLRALDALKQYYGKLEGKLTIKIVGPNSHWMDPNSDLPEGMDKNAYLASMRSKVRSSAVLTQNIEFCGEISDEEYARAVIGARFLWHPTIIDNGTFAVAEAAWLGCPSLASGYPQMRYIGERFNIPMQFFNAMSVEEMAKALKIMESNAESLRKRLPDRDDLKKHSWQNYAAEYWDMLRGIAA
jgi:glycosyltransferase involved in cell wall biosynthesis